MTAKESAHSGAVRPPAPGSALCRPLASLSTWLRSPKPLKPAEPRALANVSRAEADQILAEQPGWRVAPEQRDNTDFTRVWLQREVPEGESRPSTTLQRS